jgi:hypothetical protein
MNEQTTKTHQRKGVCFLSDLLEKLVQARMKKKVQKQKKSVQTYPPVLCK